MAIGIQHSFLYVVIENGVNLNPKQKFILFRQQKRFCSAPWNLLYISPDGSVPTCTKGSGKLYNVNDTDIETIVQGQKFQDIRRNILADSVVENCTKCYTLENRGDGQSQYHHIRNMYNELFIDQTVDYNDLSGFKLGAVDLHWSSICDLKCITCWSKQSSSIAKEQNLPIQHTKTQTALKIIDFLVLHQSGLKEVYLSGGEPTLIKYNLNLLRRLDKRPDLLIRVNSNMMWDTSNEIVQEILKFPQVMFTCSADNLGDKFAYIRRGATWQRMVDNLCFLQKCSNVDIRINSVFFVLSAMDLHDTINYFHDEHQISNFTINQCGMGHTYLRCRNLPENQKQLVREQLSMIQQKYQDNLNLVGSINNCQTELDHTCTESYKSYLDEIDVLAKADWRSLWPELA